MDNKKLYEDGNPLRCQNASSEATVRSINMTRSTHEDIPRVISSNSVATPNTLKEDDQSSLDYSDADEYIYEDEVPPNFVHFSKEEERKWKENLYSDIDKNVTPVINKYGMFFNKYTQTRKIRDKAKSYFNNIVMRHGPSDIGDEVSKLIKFIPGKLTFDIHFWYGLFYSIYRIIRHQSGPDLFLSLTNLVNHFLLSSPHRGSNAVFQIVNDFIESFKKHYVFSESLPDFETKFSLVDYIKVILDSKLVSSIRTFTLNLVGLRFFSKDIAMSFIKTLGPAEPVSIVDFSINLLTLIENMVHVAGDIFSGKGFIKSLCAGDPVSRWLDHATTLSSQYKNVYLGEDVNFPHLIENGMINAKKYHKDLQEAIQGGKHIMSSTKGVPTLFKSKLNQLVDLQYTVFQKMAGQVRMAPLGVIISGPPSIGKSSLIDHIAKIYCKYNDLKFSKDIIYHRPANSRHWTNYTPATQPIIHYSELGSMHKNIAAKNGDEVINELLNVLDSQPYQVEMADIENKGKVFVMANLVLMDVNDPKLNLDVIQNNPAAVRRRFLYIDVQVKDEYRKPNSTELDKTKISDIVDKMNLWNFKIYSEVAHGIKDSITHYYSPPNSDTNIFDIYSLSAFMFERMKLHSLEQEKYKVAVSEDISKYLEPKIKSESTFSDDSDTYRDQLFGNTDNIGSFMKPAFKEAGIPLRENSLMGEYCKKHNSMENIKSMNWDIYRGGIFAAFIGSTFLLSHVYLICTLPVFYVTYSAGRIICNDQCFCHDFPWYKKITFWGLDKCTTMWLEINAMVAISKSRSNPDSIVNKLSWIFFVPMYLYGRVVKHKDNLLYKWSADLVVFVFILIIIRLFIKLWKMIFNNVESESELINSSGRFNKDNYKHNLAEMEKNLNCEFPKARKKTDKDKDYDHIESFIPRIISDEVSYNKTEEVVALINKNVRYFYVTIGDKSARSVGVGICEDYMLMNRHNFVDGAIMSISKSPDIAMNITYVSLDVNKMKQVGDDVCVVRVIGCMFKDIRGTLTNLPSFSTTLTGYINDTKVEVTNCKEPITVQHNLSNYSIVSPLQYHLDNHYKGLCGSPLILCINNQTVLSGIHSAATPDKLVFASRVDKDKVLLGIKLIKQDSSLAPVFSEGAIRLATGTTLGKVTDKSPLLYEDVSGLDVIGSIQPYRNVTPKTTILKSPLIPHIENLIGCDPRLPSGDFKYLPPMMRSKRINGKFVSPSNNWIKKVGVEKMPLDSCIMERVTDSLSRILTERLRSKGIKNLSPYPISISQNGYPENIYIRAMKNGTSGGFLLPGKKSKYNTPVSYDFKSDSVEPDFTVVEQVLETFDSYSNCENSHTLVGAQMKDEPRPYEKVQNGKTRIFAMSSYDSTLCQRSILMPFYALMCSERDLFCTKVGINMHSEEASDIYNSLKNFSPYIMEGDYGGYDTSMPIGIGLITNSVVVNVLKALGYNSAAINKAEGILSDNLFPTVCMEGNIFVAPGFQPSGKYATAEDNSLRGLVLLYYAYVCMCTEIGRDHPANITTEFEIDSFFDLLLPITYGDDMLCGVKPELAKYFNNITYSYFVGNVYKMEFTTSDKMEQQNPFVDIDSISFLKRNFVYNKMLDRIVARLDIESLLKSLMYILPSKEVSTDTQIAETCCSCLRELFFHCETVEEYENYKTRFVNKVALVTNFKEKDVAGYFPSGLQLYEQYKPQNYVS